MTSWDRDELDALRGRLEASPHVVRLSAGPAGTVATYLPGQRIAGIRLLDDGQVEVHVVMHVDSTVSEVESAVAEAVGEHFGLAALFIEDVEWTSAAPDPELTPAHASDR